MLATPTLWTPRSGPWWRLPRLDALFMAHIKKSASTGHLLKTATGHLSKGCGGVSASGCICNGSGAGTCRVVFSGVTLCDCTDKKKVSEPVDGTFDVPLVDNPGSGVCTYRLDTPHLLEVYNDADCTDLFEQIATRLEVVTQNIFGGLIGTIDFGGYASFDQEKLFASSGGSLVSCTTGTTFSNDNTGCGIKHSYGGTATLTFF